MRAVLCSVAQQACCAIRASQLRPHECKTRSPNRISLARFTSPSGPDMVVRVCPHRGPGGLSIIGKGLGLGTLDGL